MKIRPLAVVAMALLMVLPTRAAVAVQAVATPASVEVVRSGSSAATPSVFVDVETSLGTIRLEVFAEKAPQVATWFLNLVDAGSFNGTGFYRAGHLGSQDPRPRFLEGGVLAPFFEADSKRHPANASEAGIPVLTTWEADTESGLSHERGMVSLGRDITGAGAVIPELVILLEAMPELASGTRFSPDGRGFPVFAKVVSNMALVERMAALPRGRATYVPMLTGQVLQETVRIQTVKRVPSPAGGQP